MILIDRVNELSNGIDTTRNFARIIKSVLVNSLSNTKGLFCTNSSDICDCNYFIITVPTPR